MSSPFRVVFSEATRRQLLQCYQGASTPHLAARVLEAARAILARLESDPLEFGEPLRRLHELQLEKRVGAERPLVVTYAVDEQRRLVYVTAVHRLEEPGSPSGAG
jgi:hypothetical protein